MTIPSLSVEPRVPAGGLRSWLRRHPLISFFVLAYAFSWLVSLPYLLSVTVLPLQASAWVLRVTPAAAFALQQSEIQYPQVDNIYSPADGYFPLAPWAGFAVLVAWAALALGGGALVLRRRDA